MGSAGSVAYTKKSDLDIWLCHRPDLSAKQIDGLQQKALAIEEWAKSLGLEAHIYLVDTEGFRRGEGSQISAESCGTTQHYLLLEEFYRTGSYIAGKIPVWWLVPSEQERSYKDYVAHLNKNRFIAQGDVLDFGGLDAIPPEEFIGAGLWHLYKAINQPYKSLLKLLLMEAYANNYPNTAWLSVELKNAVYQGTLDLDQLDPYILMYRKVEEYLEQRGEPDRLQLARYCFYRKACELNSKVPANSAQHEATPLSDMLRDWEREGLDLPWINNQKDWRIRQALKEHQLITRELILSYRILNQFAGKFAGSQDQQNRELKLLGRKLYSVLEKKPGKIDVIRSDSSVELAENKLIISETQLADGGKGWTLSSGESELNQADSDESLKKSRSLLEILAWTTLNGLNNAKTDIQMNAETLAIDKNEIIAIRNTLLKFSKRHLSDSDTLDVFAEPSEIKATALFLNIGKDPMSIREDGMQTASNRSDALSYGSFRKNLICSIDQFVITSWQESLIFRYADFTGLFDCLCEIINSSRQSLEQLKFECFCFASSRAKRIASRIEEVFENLRSVFAVEDDKISPRFILRGGPEFHVFTQIKSVLRYWNVIDEKQLFLELASTHPYFSPVTFDNEAMKNSAIPAIYQHNQSGIIQVFYTSKGQNAHVYILDERGSLFYRQHEYINRDILLQPYSLFFETVLRHYTSLADIPIKFYCVHRETTEEYSVTCFDLQTKFHHKMVDIRVSADELALSRTAYTIYVNDREFSSMDLGDKVFDEATNAILEFRQGNTSYPIFITDVDVPLKLLGVEVLAQLQTVHLFKYRQKIEERLNKS